MERCVTRWRQHVDVLAGEIGPRGSTTEGERRGHQYCETVLRDLGYTPQVESFTSARSAFQVHLIVGLLMIGAFVAYLLSRPVVAAILSGVALYCVSMEMLFRNNPARRLIRKGTSQNVYAVAEPQGEHHSDLILMGHVDTLRTPFFFQRRIVDIWRAYSTVTLLTFMLQTVLYIVAIVVMLPFIIVTGVLSAILAAVLVGICWHADTTPYTPGANDNATGAGLVLTLAEQLIERPLANTRVWLVCSGCEEVKHYGADHFFRTHRAEFKRPAALIFEMLGCAGPGWLSREGVAFPFLTRADVRLNALCAQIAAEQPQWRASPTMLIGGNTEMADALRYGVPAVTLIGISVPVVKLGYKGEDLYWHRRDDTPDKLNPEVMARAYGFTAALIDALDSGPLS